MIGAERKVLACAQKRSYPTEKRARQVRHERMTADPTVILRVYGCLACGQWHLTAQPLHDRKEPTP